MLMPQNYNIPIWFTPQYRRDMSSVLSQLDSAFQLDMTIGDVLRYVADHELDGPRSGREVDRTRIIWWGNDFNIGWHALFAAPPVIYRHLFPSAAKSAIEVYESGPSAAEDDALTSELAESLSLEHEGLARVSAIDSVCSEIERQSIVAVLRIIGLRKDVDECGSIALKALQDYWLVTGGKADE